MLLAYSFGEEVGREKQTCEEASLFASFFSLLSQQPLSSTRTVGIPTMMAQGQMLNLPTVTSSVIWFHFSH